MTKINEANVNMMEQNSVNEICFTDLKKKDKIEKSKNDLKRHSISIEVIDKASIDKTIRLELRNPDNECIVKKIKINDKSDDNLSKFNDSLIENCDTNGVEDFEYLNGDGDVSSIHSSSFLTRLTHSAGSVLFG
ncbi:unnamed protein product [Pieris macdunnoughi]|uniref:Uncharacterized protein n=1 Tax=Pieris macdunnoughi TaxID=345717 RepID=A0A821TPF7_9NEOP|nr:unnamed protein product [Pieris macdunnoughi]